MNLPTDSDTLDTRTAKEYMLEHRDKIMVLKRADGVAPLGTDFFTVQSVGTHPSGLVVTAIFEHNRRQHLRPADIRRATDSEIAGQKA